MRFVVELCSVDHRTGVMHYTLILGPVLESVQSLEVGSNSDLVLEEWLRAGFWVRVWSEVRGQGLAVRV